jgi:hypothetical protein
MAGLNPLQPPVKRPKGTPKTGGRVKGTRNRVTTALLDAIHNAFEEVGGQKYLVKVAQEDPKTFCQLLVRAMPVNANFRLGTQEGDPIRDLIAQISGKTLKPVQQKQPITIDAEKPSEKNK